VGEQYRSWSEEFSNEVNICDIPGPHINVAGRLLQSSLILKTNCSLLRHDATYIGKVLLIL
jgi:hypothetical protein